MSFSLSSRARFILAGLLATGFTAALHATDSVSTQSEITAPAPELSSVLSEALNNPAVRAARASWEAARERSTVSRSWPDPMLTYGYFTSNVETRVGAMNQKITLSQKIPFPGKLSEAGDLAAQDALIAMWRYRAQLSVIIAQTKSIWFDLYRVDASVKIINEQSALLTQVATTAQNAYEDGNSSLPDILKARLAVDNLRTQLITLAQQRAGLVARLNAILNRQTDSELGEINAFPTLPDLPTEASLQPLAATHRQDLQQAGVGITRGQIALSLAQRDRRPDFTVGVDYTQINRNIFSNPTDNGRDAAMVFFSVNLPIHRDKLRAQERGARHQLEAAREMRDATRLQVQAEVRDTWHQAQGYEAQIALFRETLLPQAQETWRASRQGYADGKVSLIDVLDSERTLLTLRLGLIQNEAQLGQAYAALERAVGVDLSTLQPISTPTDSRHE